MADKLTREDVIASMAAMRTQAEALKIEGAGAVLHGADLAGIDLSKLDLRGSNFHGADLTGAKLANSDLRGVNLHGAKLRNADCNGAKFDGANLCEACLCGARFVGASMEKVNLSNACVESCVGLDYAIEKPSTKNLNKHALAGKTLSIGGGVLRVLGKAMTGANVSGLRETHELPENPEHVQSTVAALDAERGTDVAALKATAAKSATIELKRRKKA